MLDIQGDSERLSSGFVGAVDTMSHQGPMYVVPLGANAGMGSAECFPVQFVLIFSAHVFHCQE